MLVKLSITVVNATDNIGRVNTMESEHELLVLTLVLWFKKYMKRGEGEAEVYAECDGLGDFSHFAGYFVLENASAFVHELTSLKSEEELDEEEYFYQFSDIIEDYQEALGITMECKQYITSIVVEYT